MRMDKGLAGRPWIEAVRQRVNKEADEELFAVDPAQARQFQQRMARIVYGDAAAETLRRMWSNQLPTMWPQLQQLQDQVAKVAAPALAAYPDNWRGGPKVRQLLALRPLAEAGYPISWVPRYQVLAELLSADDRAAVLGARRDDVLDDCEQVLAEITAHPASLRWGPLPLVLLRASHSRLHHPADADHAFGTLAAGHRGIASSSWSARLRSRARSPAGPNPARCRPAPVPGWTGGNAAGAVPADGQSLLAPSSM